MSAEPFTLAAHVVLEASLVDLAEGAISLAIGVDCRGALHVPLSPTGELPATHRGCPAVALRASDYLALSELMISPGGATRVWRAVAPLDPSWLAEVQPGESIAPLGARWSWALVLEHLNLREIPPPPPPWLRTP